MADNSYDEKNYSQVISKNLKGYHAYDIDKKREALSKVLPMLQEKGLIDINEFALSMIEAVNLLILYLEILNKVIDLEDFLYYNNNTFH